jgi:AhpC/TSA family
MFTLIDDGVAHEIEATIEDGRVRVAADALREIGWELHPEGLCREGLCIPVPEGVELEVGGRIDLGALARVLDRPLALDLQEQVAYLGVSAGDRARALRSLSAPDFTLPDLAGRPHRLSDHRGKKVLLVAYASW